MRKCSLLIATDTSIIHIAYQVETKIVELFGPSCLEVCGAWPLDDPRHQFVIDKGPCYRSMRKEKCPEGIACLENISAKEVIEKGESLLS